MDKKRQLLIFVGYCEDMKVYILFDPISKEMMFPRAINFHEHFNGVDLYPPNCHDDDSAEHANGFVFIKQENN